MIDADRVRAKYRALQRLQPGCSFGRCDQPRAFDVVAGTPGTGQCFDGGACHNQDHLKSIKKRAEQASRYAHVHVTPVADAAAAPPEQTTLI
jgi:hypothetical protein